MSDPTSDSTKSAPSAPPPGYQNKPSYQPAPANYGGADYNPTPPVQHSKPRAAGYTSGGGVKRPADNYLTLSIVLTILCCVCTGLSSLICTVPALIFANNAREAEARGNEPGRRTNARLSLGFNISAIVWWLILATAIIISTVVYTESSSSSTADDTATTMYHDS